MNHSFKRNRGFTLIELMISIAIIVIAILAIMGRVASTKQSSQVQGEAGNIQAIITAAQTSFAGRPNFTGLDNTYLINVNGFPSQMMNGVNPVNVWGGGVTVIAAAAPVQGEITYDAVPSSACIDLVNAISRNVSAISVAGNVNVKKVTDQINDLTETTSACGKNILVPVKMTFSN